VQWSREEEFRFNYVGPQFSHRIQAGVTGAGDIAYWHHRMVGSPILASSAMVPEHLHWAADLPADPGTWRSADLPYQAPHRRVDFADVRKPMPTGAWRGLGATPNTFAVECAIDELSELAAADPLAFRVRHATDARLAHVLERVEALSGWSADSRGLGVAAAAYKSATFVAVVAQVARDGDSIRVEHLWCAQDCGLAVCPDQVRAQIEGNLVWGIGMVLHEEFRLEDGLGATANFDSYRIARNTDVPAIEVEIVDSELPPTGSGEAAFAPAAAAIVNAIHSEGGGRMRALPLGGRT
jgi:isoquinoline 1-oxidoreductase beta subunit